MTSRQDASQTDRVRGAMRSGEWLRTQWIARVAFDLGDGPWVPTAGIRARRSLKHLEARGEVERRDAQEHREGVMNGVRVAYDLPRDEWRLRRELEDEDAHIEDAARAAVFFAYDVGEAFRLCNKFERDVATLREALEGLMSHARSYLEPAGSYADAAMHRAREAMTETDPKR